MAATPEADTATRQYRQQLLAVRAFTLQDVTRAWSTWQPGRVATYGRFVDLAVPLITGRYGQAAALAVGYLDRFRRAEGVRGNATPKLPAAPDADTIIASLRATGLSGTMRAIRAGFSPQAASRAGLVQALGSAGRLALNGGRDAILESVHADPRALGWRRVTAGGPCDFCAMLAGRGPVYKTDRTAGFQAHDHCACSAEPVYRDGAGTTPPPQPPAREPKPPAPEPMPAKDTPEWRRWRAARGTPVRGALLPEQRRQFEERRARMQSEVDRLSAIPAIGPNDSQVIGMRKIAAEYEQALAAAPPLPDFDPADPLAFYGNLLEIGVESDKIARELRNLEQHVPHELHEALRDRMLRTPGAGIYIGDQNVTDLDDLGHLKGQRTSDGRIWDNSTIGGLYDRGAGVLAVSEDAWARTLAGTSIESTTTGLHEFGHAIDNAFAARLGRTHDFVSDDPEFRGIYEHLHDEARQLKPYFSTRQGQHRDADVGRNEFFAESFSTWLRWRRDLGDVTGDRADARLAVRMLEAIGASSIGTGSMNAMIRVIRFYERMSAGA